MVVSRGFVPRIPQPVQPMQPVPAPFPLRKGYARARPERQETLVSWALSSLREGIKSLPKVGGQLALQIGIVVAINLILWPLKTYTLPRAIASLVSAVIFLTATYNNVIPKTIYWVIVFTFGRRLVAKIRTEGFARAIAPMRGIMPELRKAQATLGERARALLLAGAGAGLMIANNFASYSRFPDARNKSDKYLVALVISFTVSYLLGERQDGGLFKFMRLANSDLCRMMKKPSTYTDNHTFVLLSGFVAGLLLDAPLIVLKLKYGGYIAGALCLVASLAMGSGKASPAKAKTA